MRGDKTIARKMEMIEDEGNIGVNEDAGDEREEGMGRKVKLSGGKENI